MRAKFRLDVGTLGSIVLGLSMVLLVDAFWPRLQVLVTGGYPVPAAGLKPLVALVSIAAVLWLRKRLPAGFLLLVSIGFVVVMAITMANLTLLQDVPVREVLVSQNAYYWPYLLLPLLLGVHATVSSKHFSTVLLGVGLPLAAFGLLQFVVQRPIVSIEVPEAGFVVNSWRFHGTGQLRAFSLFGSGQTFGYLLAPLAALLVVKVVRARGLRRIWFGAGLALVAFTTFATLTRNTYLVVALVVVAAVGYLTSLQCLIWALPIATLIIAILGTFVLTGVMPEGASGGIWDATSLWMRLDEWQVVLDRYASSAPAAQMFGLGLVQNEQASGSLRVLVDNSFLAVLLNSGALGLVGWTGLMLALWTQIHVATVRSRDDAQIAIAASFSTWAIVGLFNVSIAVFGIYAIWAFLLVPEKEMGAENQSVLLRPASTSRTDGVGQGATGAAPSPP